MHKCPKCKGTWTIHKGGLFPEYLDRLNIKTKAWYPTDELPLEDQEDCPACELGGQWDFCSVHMKYVVSAYHAGAAAFKSGRPCIPALDQSFHALLDGVKVGEGIPLLNAWIKGWTNANLREV